MLNLNFNHPEMVEKESWNINRDYHGKVPVGSLPQNFYIFFDKVHDKIASSRHLRISEFNPIISCNVQLYNWLGIIQSNSKHLTANTKETGIQSITFKWRNFFQLNSDFAYFHNILVISLNNFKLHCLKLPLHTSSCNYGL